MGLFSSTESPNLSSVSPDARTVRLSGHSTIDLSDVDYDTFANRFYYGGLDVTSLLSTPQRLAFPSYASAGIVRTNDANYIAKTGDTASGGSSSTLGNFASGVGSDVAGIANGIRKFFAGDPDKPGEASDLKKLLVVAIIGGLMFGVYKLIQAFKSK